jgi:hypothetical protein
LRFRNGLPQTAGRRESSGGTFVQDIPKSSEWPRSATAPVPNGSLDFMPIAHDGHIEDHSENFGKTMPIVWNI